MLPAVEIIHGDRAYLTLRNRPYGGGTKPATVYLDQVLDKILRDPEARQILWERVDLLMGE